MSVDGDGLTSAASDIAGIANALMPSSANNMTAGTQPSQQAVAAFDAAIAAWRSRLVGRAGVTSEDLRTAASSYTDTDAHAADTLRRSL